MTPATPLELLRLTLPAIIVALTGLVALTLDLTLMQRRHLALRWRVGASVACPGSLAAILLIAMRPEQASLFEGMLVVNPATQLVQVVLATFTILAVLLSLDSTFTSHVGEYLAIVLFATASMMILVSTHNLLVIFASLELLSLSLYLLTGFNKRSRQSAEAALKYFLFGGMATAFFLFGISLLYGLSGSIDLKEIANGISAHGFTPMSAVALVMFVTGLGFKVAAAPFHLWAPDAYQGAPTPSAAYIASASKIASFFLFAMVITLGFTTGASRAWHAPALIGLVAAISMALGNLAAIVQGSVRRLIAYSAIGHAGYILLGTVSNGIPGLSSLLYYVITYALATLGTFGVLAALEKHSVDSLSDFAGLARRSPSLSFCMMIFLLSLAGIPPLAGFFGKFYIFSVVIANNAGWLWLVILAIAMSAVSLYYYLRVLKQIYVRDPADDADRIETPLAIRATVGSIAALVVVLGCFPSLLLGWIDNALRAMPR